MEAVDPNRLLGVGIFYAEDVAALLGTNPGEVRRWSEGYSRRRGENVTTYDPLIKTDLPRLEGEQAMTFVELVELMYIHGFREAGVTWNTIKEASRVAARIFVTEHPFAMKRFFADPKGIYAELEGGEDNQPLVELIGNGQHTISKVVKPYLGQLEFNPEDVAERWWPMGRTGRVVVDPTRSFGAPVVDEVGIPTRVLADAFDAEARRDPDNATRYVAWMYRVKERHVETALNFRRWLRSSRSSSSMPMSRQPSRRR